LGVYAYNESNAFTPEWTQLTPNFNSAGVFTGYTLNGQPYTGTVKKKTVDGQISIGGDVNWEDVDKNGNIDAADKQILGNAQPDWFGGLTNEISYKNFTASATFYASIGGSIYNQARWNKASYQTTGNTPDPYIIINAWNKAGDITDVPDPKTGSTIGNTREISSFFVEDASYIRLRNVRITYALPAKVASSIGARRVLFGVTGKNLLTYSNYSWSDPEFSYTNPLQMGVDANTRSPRKNEIEFSLNVNF
jgi:hypothetical protein